MHRLNKAQRRWLEQLYLREHDALFAFALRRLADRTQAEDAVQEAYRVACVKIAAVMASPSPGGWLVETLKRVMANELKRRARQSAHLAPETGQEPAAPPDGAELDIAGAQILGEREYALLRRVLLKEITVKEAADVLGVSEAACRKRMERARKKLRRELDGP